MCTDIVIYLQHFDQSIISSPSAPLSSNNSITSFLSLFWSLISSPLVFFFPYSFLCLDRKLFVLCNVFLYLWAFHVWPAQSRGCFKNTQCFGERVLLLLLQPPLLLHCSHFPEKLLPGLTGFPELPSRQWEPQEVRGGCSGNPPCLDWNAPHTGDFIRNEMGGRDRLFFAGSSSIPIGCQHLFNTQLYCPVSLFLYIQSKFVLG